MVAESIIALVVFVMFLAYLWSAFFFSILELIINGSLLYAVLMRSYVELRKESKHYFYLGGAAAGMAVYAAAGNFLSGILVWGITSYLIISFAIAQIAYVIHSQYAKSIKKKNY